MQHNIFQGFFFFSVLKNACSSIKEIRFLKIIMLTTESLHERAFQKFYLLSANYYVTSELSVQFHLSPQFAYLPVPSHSPALPIIWQLPNREGEDVLPLRHVNPINYMSSNGCITGQPNTHRGKRYLPSSAYASSEAPTIA